VPVFYRSASVLVTDRVFKVIATPEHVIAINQIDHVYVVRTGTRFPARVLAMRLWPAALAVVISTGIVINDFASSAGGPQLISAMALAICGLTMLFSATASTSPANELWAVINGRHECLLREQNQRTFGQIQRALMRARERVAW
jgi:hypothetical protein